ncbi:hypothetical protein MTO96_032365 [Rhipicephalus appendiculatus]
MGISCRKTSGTPTGNLSLKVVMMLRWTLTHCPQARFLVKTDDDSFPNLSNLYKAMHGQTEHSIYGEIRRGSIIIRNQDSKWYISYEEYPGDVAPEFITGGMYVIRRARGGVTVQSYRSRQAIRHGRYVSYWNVRRTRGCEQDASVWSLGSRSSLTLRIQESYVRSQRNTQRDEPFLRLEKSGVEVSQALSGLLRVLLWRFGQLDKMTGARYLSLAQTLPV